MWATGDGEQAGFTLLEVLVALAIVALVSVAIPLALPHLLPAQQLRTDAESLAARLRETRAEAALLRKPIELHFNGTGQGVDRASREPLWRASRDVTVASHSYGNDPTLRFYADGSTSGGLFTLTLDGRQMTVDVSPMTGRIRVGLP